MYIIGQILSCLLVQLFSDSSYYFILQEGFNGSLNGILAKIGGEGSTPDNNPSGNSYGLPNNPKDNNLINELLKKLNCLSLEKDHNEPSNDDTQEPSNKRKLEDSSNEDSNKKNRS